MYELGQKTEFSKKPLSRLAFSNKLGGIWVDSLRGSLKDAWERKGYGTIIASTETGNEKLTYMMFADDTTLMPNHEKRCRTCSATSKLNLEKWEWF